MNKEKKEALEKKHKASLEMGNNLPSVYSDEGGNANKGTERMLR